MRKNLIVSILVLLLLVGLGILGHRRLIMEPATGLGVQGGALSACPASPNCVSTSAADEAHRVEPLVLQGDADAAMSRLREIVEQMPRMRIVDSTASYLHAEATSLIWRYVDDLEIYVDAAGSQIHLRSASRTGYSDLGVNRDRIEALATAYRASR